MDNTDFRDYTSDDFRSVQKSLSREIDELQVQKLELVKQKRTIETVMYMLFPKEALRDGYLSANTVIAQRLKREKDKREEHLLKPGKKKGDRSKLAALAAEHFEKNLGGMPAHVVR